MTKYTLVYHKLMSVLCLKRRQQNELCTNNMKNPTKVEIKNTIAINM